MPVEQIGSLEDIRNEMNEDKERFCSSGSKQEPEHCISLESRTKAKIKIVYILSFISPRTFVSNLVT